MSTAIDKSDWGPGPWQDEPDRVKWVCEGFNCLILRVEGLGHLCGYVEIPPRHPWYRSAPDDFTILCHGGITYDCSERPGSGLESGFRWVGFDAAHARDFAPGSDARLRRIDPNHVSRFGHPTGWGETVEYRTIEYMKRECERVVAQLAMAVNGGLHSWHAAFADAAAWENPVCLTNFVWHEEADVLDHAEFTYRGHAFTIDYMDRVRFTFRRTLTTTNMICSIGYKSSPLAYLSSGIKEIESWLNGR
jgi:hypothetical protein